MEAIVITFAIAFFFSFIGTIPPGTLNLSIIQMGLEHRVEQAWRFALASSIVEYFYAWVAVKFESLITSSPAVTENFELITAIVMLTLGSVSLIATKKPFTLVEKFHASGFRKGFILGILNPMALPFWVAMTAYIRSQRWAMLASNVELHAYLLGVALGGFALMMLLFVLARKVVAYFQNNILIDKIPGAILLVLGCYAMIRYLL
jgi:threonine/homoserine/homoserine lactone efflux protein